MSKNSAWAQDIEVLLDAETVAKRVAELGKGITADYAGSQVTLVGILKGCFVFFSDVARAIDLPVRCEFIGISSYGDDTTSSGVVQITSDLTNPIQGEHVLIIEDIVDTGLTMKYLLENFATRGPKSIKICTLLHKPDNAQVEIPLDYVGFIIPDKFVVGYGLDLANLYRNLPYIGVYRGQA